MMGDTPIRRAQLGLSSEGLRRRMDAAEQRALGPKPRKKQKAKAKPKTAVYRPPAAGVAAQKQRELDARAADEAALRARGLRR